MKKMDQTLLVFTIIFNTILILLLLLPSLLSIFLIPLFMLVSLLVSVVLFSTKRMDVVATWDKILFLFATPVPLIVIGFISSFFPAKGTVSFP